MEKTKMEAEQAENGGMAVGKPEPNPEWEAKAKALRDQANTANRISCEATGDPVIDPAATLTMLQRWTPDAEPANEHGQISFARCMLESAEDALRYLIDQNAVLLHQRDEAVARALEVENKGHA